jgi:hypothetical protein
VRLPLKVEEPVKSQEPAALKGPLKKQEPPKMKEPFKIGFVEILVLFLLAGAALGAVLYFAFYSH